MHSTAACASCDPPSTSREDVQLVEANTLAALACAGSRSGARSPPATRRQRSATSATSMSAPPSSDWSFRNGPQRELVVALSDRPCVSSCAYLAALFALTVPALG